MLTLTTVPRNTRLQGDLIILGRTSPPASADSLPSSLPPTIFPKDSLLARYAFSQALARSTALSALEESLDRYLSSVALLPHALEKTGKPGLSRTALIKKLGELMKFRQGLNLNRENVSDTPDFYWAEPELEGEPCCGLAAEDFTHTTTTSTFQFTQRCSGCQGPCCVRQRQNHVRR